MIVEHQFCFPGRLEPEQLARRSQLDSSIDRHGHLGHEGALALRWHVLLNLLLAH